jgi:hypothetical protein
MGVARLAIIILAAPFMVLITVTLPVASTTGWHEQLQAEATCQSQQHYADTAAVPDRVVASDTLLIPSRQLQWDFHDARSADLRADGTLFITDAGSGNLYTFRLDSATLVPHILVPGLEVPNGLALVMDTYTAVASSESGEIILLDEELTYMRTVTVPSWAPGASGFYPSDVAANEFGELFILDGVQRRIYQFNANGAYLQHFELGDMVAPVRLAYYSESLFITDSGSGKLRVLTDTGRELAVIGTFPGLSRVRIIDDVIWVLSDGIAHLFSMAGEHIGNLKPEGLSGPLVDVAGDSNRVFLLTDSSLYFWTLEP